MRHIIFEAAKSYQVGLLIKGSSFAKPELLHNYINPLTLAGVDKKRIIGFDLDYVNKKCPMKVIVPCLDNTLKALDSLGVTTLYVADAAYCKKLTGVTNIQAHYGYVMDCKYKGYEHMKVIPAVNYGVLFHNPMDKEKLDMCNQTLADHIQNNYSPIGEDILHYAAYPDTLDDIKAWLKKLHEYPSLTVDIEAFSLRFNKAGIGTISFAWDKHNGIGFAVDYRKREVDGVEQDTPDENGFYGFQWDNKGVKALLRQFFVEYKGNLKYHNANYDVKILIYELFMHAYLDQTGLLRGLSVMTKDIDDTKIVAYLAVNSCARNNLGLKYQAHEYAGNYAVDDIHDIRKIALEPLLKYNIIDCLATWYVFEKHWPTVIADDQEEIYNTLMIPSIKSILQMELTGMPLSMPKVLEAKSELEKLQAKFSLIIRSHAIIAPVEELIKMAAWEKDFKDRKAKAKNPDKIKEKDYDTFTVDKFNPGSPKQLQRLLYDHLQYPVINKTKTKEPSCDGDSIKQMIANARDPSHTDLLTAILGIQEVSKILSTFIEAFIEYSILKEDGWYYLHGNFNLGGTVSGRLSSSKPNLQNIPSSSTYAKIIKACFVAPPGWLFVGADFASLEDRISALTTKDPMKLKVYTDGYDGHCLRAFSYFGDFMPDIVNTVESINSIADLYGDYRQDSKAPTFLLTYQGTHIGIVNNLGWPKSKALAVEKKYHEMYKVSDDWVQEKLIQATFDGYITGAFGLRVRTPVLAQCILNMRETPFEAQAEGRTAGNALGQSYGLLNNRAGNEFQQRTIDGIYAEDIRPCAQIHDAIYLIIRNNMGCLAWANKHLPECMAWQDLDAIRHDEVKLSGEIDIFHPSWASKITLKAGISNVEIRQTIVDAAAKAKKKAT